MDWYNSLDVSGTLNIARNLGRIHKSNILVVYLRHPSLILSCECFLSYTHCISFQLYKE
jgi:hypothetical protein